MSTILKALRRLEEEKSRGATSRPLREEVASGPSEPPRRRLPWLPVAAVLVGAGLGASAWWVWPYERGGEPVRETASEPVAAATAQAAPPVVDSHVTQRVPPGFNDAAAQVEDRLHELAQTGAPDDVFGAPVPTDDPLAEDGGPPEDAFASQVEVVERPRPEPRIAPTAPGAPQERVIRDPAHVAKEPPAVTARHTPRSEVTAARAETSAATAAARAQQARVAPVLPDPTAARRDPVTEQPPRPREEPAPSARAAEPAPAPRPAPAQAKRAPASEQIARKSAPAAVAQSDADSALHVRRTQWHPEPARRSADLEVAGRSQSVHEGDVVGDYVVTEIRPSGVVLSRDGKRIERGIGK